MAGFIVSMMALVNGWLYDLIASFFRWLPFPWLWLSCVNGKLSFFFFLFND
jgi:hypothetical protein